MPNIGKDGLPLGSHWAPIGLVMGSISQGHRRLVRLLLKAGAQPDAQVEDCVNCGRFAPAMEIQCILIGYRL